MSIRKFIKRTQLLLDQALYESRRALRTEDAGQAVNVAALEERLLMSASPVAAVAEAAQPETPASETPEPPAPTAPDQATQQQTLDLLADETLPAAVSVTERPGSPATESDLEIAQTLELVFIDGSISNLDQMVSDLENEDALDENRSLEIVVLDTQRDGVAQITAALLQYDGIDGVHIVSHGSGGEVRLGSTVLSLDTIDTYRSAINAWQHSFTEEADLLFYGCHLAATEDGRELMAQISGECDCDVSASEDLTGHADLGGDWELEYQVGTVSTDVVFSSQLQGSWQGVLGAISVTTTDDVLDGDADLTSLAALLVTPGSDGEISLREAILAANNDAGTDTISFAISAPLVNGAHTISLASALPDITDTLIINGASEPDYAANGNAPVVVLDGGGSVPTGLVVTATADNSEIRGLSFRDLTSSAIVINGGADGVTVVGNYIGRLATDGTDSGSGDINGAGVFVNGANAVIGGTTAADRNVIAGVTSAIFLDGSSATGAVISGNYIGLSADGLTVIGTTSDGIRLENGAHTNTIGGATAAAGNVIAGTGRDGIRIDGSATDDNTVASNLFGVSADGTTRLGTVGSGVYVTNGADRTLIEDNLIAAAGTTGITIDGSSDATRIEGNTIGTNAAGTLNWGSAGDGILLTGAVTNSVIGTTAAGDGNTIVFSGQQSGDGAGISILDGATGNAIRGNAIHSNAGLGIDLAATANDGADVNDLTDADTGGNTRLNTPVLHTATLSDAGNLAAALDLTALPAGTY
ncbi:MAG: DUF4347 domain-containing protein, partial [Planctomycetaceae bacterium]|nr:DUF4347 domain-containing protein [Planctomycetaceae bacterium]